MKIEKLPDEVIKKICAGEVITRPYNVVKELLENSIDAKSTNISITISSDVLTVQIEDNGHGIQQEDFNLLCERHCTSKLKVKDGVSFLSTYGFRGEALSSISQVAKITVKSKPAQCEYGYEGKYSYGELTDIKPVSIRDGTIFVIKDIFYNNKIRELKYFKKINELNSILELVFYYAVCNTQTRFVFNVSGKEKFMSKGGIECGDDHSHVIKNTTNTSTSNVSNSFHSDLLTLRNSIIEDSNINNFHAKTCLDRKISLLETFYNIEDKLNHFDSKYITLIFNKPNADFKKTVFILFINGRLVENTSLKDYLTKIYLDFLPKYRYPLVYIEIRVPPEDIDINIHPSKREVMYNHEEIITEIIMRVIETTLKGFYKEDLENIGNQHLKRYKQSFKQSYAGENTNSNKIYNDPTVSSLYNGLIKKDRTVDNVVFIDGVVKKEIFRPETIDGKLMNTEIINTELVNTESINIESTYKELDECKLIQSNTRNSILPDLRTIYSLSSSYEEVDSLFFKSLTYVGLNERIEFYVQYNQYLLVCKLDKFLHTIIKEFFISNIGHLPTTSVQITLPYEIEHQEVLKIFSIETEDKMIKQVPIVYGQYNKDGWTILRETWDVSNIETTIKNTLDFLVTSYSKTFDLNLNTFNCIKRSVKGTKANIEMFSVLSNIKDLFRKFGR